MSLGFHNTAFPKVNTRDTRSSFYDAFGSYYSPNNVTTSSVAGFESGVSASYSAFTETHGGTCTAAISSTGKLAVCYESSTTLSIYNGIGGGENTVNLPGGADNWRGMVYNPDSNYFVVTADRAVAVEADTAATSSITLPYGSSQTWGSVQYEGDHYIAPIFGSTTQIGRLSMTTGGFNTSTLIGSSFTSTTNFGSPAMSRDGVLVWAGEGNGDIKEYDIVNDTFSTISGGIQYAGYQGWAPLPNGKLFSPGWNSSNYMLYTPASLNGGTSKIDVIAKGFSTTSFGPWSNVFTGLDGNAWYSSSKGVSQIGGIYTDLYCYNWRENIFFKTQYKLPANSTGGDRQNQAIVCMPDGRLFIAPNNGASVYYTVKIFDTNNTTDMNSRVNGLLPDTGN